MKPSSKGTDLVAKVWQAAAFRRFRQIPVLWPSVVASFWVLCLAGLWLAVTAAQSWLFYRSIDRQPYRTSHARIAAKKAVSSVLDPIYDNRLAELGDLPAYELELSEKRLAEWTGILRRVYARGFAEAQDQVYLPAVFRYRGRALEVDMRGRGTLFTHYKEDKPSFRVKFPKDGYVRGNRVINLIIPYDQARVVGDTTINSLARRYGFVTIPTRFVTLRLNGEMLGVYHEVEHFRKELAVKQFRSEGFFMSSLGEPKGSSLSDHPGFEKGALALSRCVVESCDGDEVRHVLDNYVDFRKMTAYAAITTLFGAKHGWGEDNLILFFDPPRGRFEPVPWDMGTLELKVGEDPFVGLESVKGIGSAFLRFDDFRLQRDRDVWDLIERHEGATLEESERLYGDIRRALNFDTEHSRRYTQRMVDYFQGALTKNFKLWRHHLEAVDLEIEAVPGGVSVLNGAAAAVTWRAGPAPTDGAVVLAGEPAETVVPGRYLDVPGKALWRDLTVAELEAGHWLNAVTGRVIDGASIRIAPDAGVDTGGAVEAPESSTSESEPTLPAGVRIAGAPDDPVWTFEGNVRLAETLVVPEGARSRFAPGLRLVLDPGVSLVMHGDLESVGSAAAPIWVGAVDPSAPFGVVAVLGRSHDPVWVRLRHTTISGGTESGYRGSHFSGMFSVYDGHLNMEHSRIEQVQGEDGLNVKFGFIEARYNEIESTHSDAVDLDFCRGVLEDNVIRGARGDSLDFSGSLILARRNQLLDTTDKGVSAGEATTAHLVENEIRRATTGVASKDSSWVVVRPGPTEGAKIGVALYQKKQIFSSGVLAAGAGSGGDATPFLLDPGAWAHRLGTDTPQEQPGASEPGS